MTQTSREIEIEHRLTKVEEACALLPEMASKLDSVSKKLAKYDGRWGAMIMLGTAIWAVFVVFKDNIMSWFKGH